MQRHTLYIIATGLAAGLVSMVYYLSLTVSVPFYVTALLSVAYLIMFFRAVSKIPVEDDVIKYPSFTPLIIAIAAAILVSKAVAVSEKYGGWDAWSVWNLHAKYLASKDHWQNLFRNTIYAHADYPLLTPGFIGFFTSLCKGSHLELISFIFSFSITLFIPVLLLFETINKSVLVATGVLFFFIYDKFYVQQGVSGYGDTPLAFFFLCAFISSGKHEYNQKWAAITGACLGCCLWAKNEGMILAVIFTTFYLRGLIASGAWKYFVGGILLPVLTLAVFKIGYAPPNDLIGTQSTKTLMQLFDFERYKMIYNSFVDNINAKYFWVGVVFFLYILSLLFRKKWPDKQMAILLVCLGVYFMVYVLSTQGLEWHLATSVDRLLHQLMPAMVYVMVGKYTNRQRSFVSFGKMM